MAAAVEAFAQVHPREYLRKFLKEHVRADGRLFDQLRKTSVVPGLVQQTWLWLFFLLTE